MGNKRATFGYLYDRPDRPGWYLRFRRNGRTVIRFAGSDKKTAEAFAARLHHSLEQEDLLGKKTIPAVTLAGIERAFFQHITARHAPSNVPTEKQRFTTLKGLFGKTPLRDIDRGMVEDALTRLRVEHGLKPATVNRYASLLSIVFKYALDRDLARDNPVRGLRREREEQLAIPFLSDADIEKICAACKTPEMAALVRVLSDTGLRRSEALRLEWRDLDMQRGVLRVQKSKTGQPREIPLTARAREALLGQAHRVGVLPQHGRGLVWVESCAVLAERVTRRFQAAAKRAGFPDLRLHDLRHGFACRLREAGVAIQVIAQLAGHRCLQTTLRYSRHMAGESLRNAISALERGQPREVDPDGYPAQAAGS